MKDTTKIVWTPPFTIISEPLSGYLRFIFLVNIFLKKILKIRTYGPNSALESILKWLQEFPDIHWNQNPEYEKIYEIVYVPIGVEALRYALWLKLKGRIKKLIVWPNITSPTSASDIFFHPEIDSIVVPSTWIRDWFFHMLGKNDSRIFLFPAWTDDLGPREKNDKVIIFKKECPENLFHTVCSTLSEEWIQYELFEYGKYDKDEYLEALSKAKFLIYLQTSETQWIALHEAWMKGVPTLVWNRGYCEYRWNTWIDSHISAPYLTDECGMFFSSENDFPVAFQLFLGKLNSYTPRKYSLDNFTHKKTITRLLARV